MNEDFQGLCKEGKASDGRFQRFFNIDSDLSENELSDNQGE